jgi:hypothetical protein
MVPLLLAEFQYGFGSFNNFMDVESVCGKCDSFVQVMEPRFDCKLPCTFSLRIILTSLTSPSSTLSLDFIRIRLVLGLELE